VRRALTAIRPGGYLGLDEVAARPRTTRGRAVLKSFRSAESAHNEAIDVEAVRRAIQREADVVETRFRYSPIRGLLPRGLTEAMRTRPWLTRLVFAFDDFCLVTVGRILRFFGPRQVLLLASKRSNSQVCRDSGAVAPELHPQSEPGDSRRP
jgi:hypothetical protein